MYFERKKMNVKLIDLSFYGLLKFMFIDYLMLENIFRYRYFFEIIMIFAYTIFIIKP